MSTVVLVLLEVLLVIGLSRLVGLVFRWLRQPLVIGEIVAGILLGPSFFGLIAPDLANALFPPETVPFLNVLSQVGLIFFMFLIGLELNPRYLQGQLEIAVLTSHVSIVVPFSLGSLLALLLYPLVSSGDVSFTAFALFLGSAMSITAFPVLARIITENNLQNSRLGTLALTCAAVDDVTAWCLLAGAIAVTRTNSVLGAIPTFVEAIVYIAIMVTWGRSFLQRLAKSYDRTGRLTQMTLALLYMAVVASALITELIGIHLIFGAFLLGAVMPKNAGLTREIAEKTEDFVLIFLLPVFFAYSGLRTEIGLLDRPILWGLCLAVLAVAISGKYVGTYVAGRVCGLPHRDASALGWLMNTRGLTELIVLNIGLSLGVISPLLFTMLVIMALVTTFMTSPLLEWTYSKQLIRQDTVDGTLSESVEPILATEEESTPETAYRILVPVANPDTQQGLLQLAVTIAGHQQPTAVYPLSLIQVEEDYFYESTPVEADRLIAERLAQVEMTTQTLILPEFQSLMRPIVRVANDVARETTQIALLNQANLILMGWHRPAFSSNRLGGRVGQILSMAQTDVAVFVERPGTVSIQSLLVPYAGSIHDDLALELALRILINHETVSLTVLQVVSRRTGISEFSYESRQIIAQMPPGVSERMSLNTLELADSDPVTQVIEASKQVDLAIVGASREWGIERQTLGNYTDTLALECHSSVLITHRYSPVNSHLGPLGNLLKSNQPENHL